MAAVVMPEGAEGAPVSSAVVVAGAVLAICAVPLFLVLPHDRIAVDGTLSFLGWFPLGVAGVVVLDRRPGSRVGWCSVLVTASPAVVMGWSTVRAQGTSGMEQSADLVGPIGLAPLLLVAGSALSARGTRAERRWAVWICLAVAGAISVSGVAWAMLGETAFGVTAFAGLGLVTCVVAGMALVAEPRPVDEPLLDVGLVVGLVVLAAGAGLAVRWVAVHERIFGANVMGAVAAASTMALAAPGALALRREVLARRYGTGALSTVDVAALTAGLSSATDPRHLLATAAEMVAATSGVTAARLVLDTDEPPTGWTDFALVVGEESVGTLMVEISDAEGLEIRQRRVVEQLLPTIALAARAVGLAVDAEHARRDLATRQAAERHQVMADLHDDIGPVLAGMSMRVEAARRAHPDPVLDDLARDLTECRAGLRRIVAGLAPRALADGDLDQAIADLISSFTSPAGPDVVLDGGVPAGIDGDVAATVYRTAAEGVTNAIRHADASVVRLGIDRSGGRVRVTVSDDGSHQRPMVPGVGLTSLRARAEQMAGTLEICSTASGTQLVVSLPDRP